MFFVSNFLAPKRGFSRRGAEEAARHGLFWAPKSREKSLFTRGHRSCQTFGVPRVLDLRNWYRRQPCQAGFGFSSQKAWGEETVTVIGVESVPLTRFPALHRTSLLKPQAWASRICKCPSCGTLGTLKNSRAQPSSLEKTRGLPNPQNAMKCAFLIATISGAVRLQLSSEADGGM